MNMRTMGLSLGVAAILLACDTRSTALEPQEEMPAAHTRTPAALNEQLARVRAATARYHNIAVALEEGFEPISQCISHPLFGGMGIHLARVDRMADADYSATEPEMLLYAPGANGAMKLVAVEYWIWEHAWNAAGRSGSPMFFDHPFDHATEADPPRYSLHVWIWQPNPSGMFAPFNPRVACPRSTAPAGSSGTSGGHG